MGKIKSDGGCFWGWILIWADWIFKGGGGIVMKSLNVGIVRATQCVRAYLPYLEKWGVWGLARRPLTKCYALPRFNFVSPRLDFVVRFEV